MVVNKENSCAFYASDYHLEMIILPYINKKFNENKNVYVFTQNDLEDTINTLVEKVNIDNKIKNKVLDINWKNEDENKYNNLINDKNAVVFIKGNEKYINKVNTNLNQIKEQNNLEVIDCYYLEEIGNKMPKIITEHSNIITTKC
ncbi:MAG: hypothetical protein IKF97_02000 [Clostridia bacterium]|nr:hypothetical protein [Clostridia bacterium]